MTYLSHQEVIESDDGEIGVAVAMAAAKAAAMSYSLPLYNFLGGNFVKEIPYPLGNMMNGGAHAGSNAPDIQEFLVVPVGANDITEAVFANVEVHKRLRELISKKDPNFTGGKGDEGGWIPNISNDQALEIQAQACEEVGDELGFIIGDQVDYVKDLIDTYHMFYVEDPFDERDFDGFADLTAKVGNKCRICGDDLFVTNSELLANGIEKQAANAIIIKPNQIGTLTDTYATVRLAKENNIMPIVSHRSGETCDDTIAHLAIAFGAPMIKTGAIGGERIAKLNELIRIEEEMSNPRMANLF